MHSSDSPRFRILELKIQDFRGIDSLHLDFTDANGEPNQLVVLAGDNGCGKTSALEAILMLLARHDLLPPDAAQEREQVRFGGTEFKLNAELLFTDGRVTERIKARHHFVAPAPGIPRMFLPGGPAGEPHWLIPNGWSWSPHPPAWPSVEYFSARREPLRRAAGTDTVGRAGRDPQDLTDLKRRLISAYYRGLRSNPTPQSGSPAPFARLQRVWASFMGDGQTLDVIPVSNDPGSGDEVVLRDTRVPIPADVTSLEMARKLAPARADIPRMVPLDRLSSGQIALFAFAGPLIFRDQPADIVIIDEPEQHLHVKWQRQIMPALRELCPTTQFFIATHSTEILDAALSYERYILVSESDPRARLAEGEGDAGDPAPSKEPA